EWVVRSDEMFLIPGDSPMGFRLPIQSLVWYEQSALDAAGYARDAFADRPALPLYHQLRDRSQRSAAGILRQYRPAAIGATVPASYDAGALGDDDFGTLPNGGNGGSAEYAKGSNGAGRIPYPDGNHAPHSAASPNPDDPAWVVRTALCVEPRGG